MEPPVPSCLFLWARSKFFRLSPFSLFLNLLNPFEKKILKKKLTKIKTVYIVIVQIVDLLQRIK